MGPNRFKKDNEHTVAKMLQVVKGAQLSHSRQTNGLRLNILVPFRTKTDETYPFQIYFLSLY